MRSGGLIIVVFLVWMGSALYAFLKTPNPGGEAKQTAAFIVAYPLLLWWMLESRPVAPIIAIPVIMAGIPWLLSGSHLAKALKSSYPSKPGEFVGLPLSYWWWGLGLSVGTALIFGK